MTNMWSEEVSTMIREGKWLFLPSSSWFGDYVIVGTYFEKDDPNAQGTIGVAATPKWEGQDQNWTYWWGGAAWVASRHSKNPQLVADFLTYMTTDVIKEQGTYPAYMPAAEEWLKNMPTKTIYKDPVAVGELFKEQAGTMWTKAAEGPVDTSAVWGPIQAAINGGEIGSYEEALQRYQDDLMDGVGKLGYEATTTGLDDFQ
jgi:ABC-type glycerol-3-phosphate transport system substrate-binding protein